MTESESIWLSLISRRQTSTLDNPELYGLLAYNCTGEPQQLGASATSFELNPECAR